MNRQIKVYICDVNYEEYFLLISKILPVEEELLSR